MFATKDRLPQGSKLACSPVAFCTSLSVPAIVTQTHNCTPHHLTAPQRPLVILKGSVLIKRPVVIKQSVVIPEGSVVIPRPEGRGICFSSARDRNALPVFNTLRPLFHRSKPQLPPAHRLAHSLPNAKSITAAFPTTSNQPARSLAPERKLSHVFSSVSALFRENTRGRVGGLCRARRPTGASVPALSGSAPLRGILQDAIRIGLRTKIGAPPECMLTPSESTLMQVCAGTPMESTLARKRRGGGRVRILPHIGSRSSVLWWPTSQADH